jgi:hypothetical protein
LVLLVCTLVHLELLMFNFRNVSDRDRLISSSPN